MKMWLKSGRRLVQDSLRRHLSAESPAGQVIFRFTYPMCPSSSPQTGPVQWMKSIWSNWRTLWLVLREKWIAIWSLGTRTWWSRRLPWDVDLSISTRTSTPSWEISLTWRTSWRPSPVAASTTRLLSRPKGRLIYYCLVLVFIQIPGPTKQ